MKNQFKNMPPSVVRVAVYVRVSSDEQAKNGDSVRDQQEACLAYINSHPETALQDIYIDDGVSGQKLERDDFARLMRNIRAGKIDMIIFTKLDRWFRSLRHYLNTQETLEKFHVSWLAINQPFFDTSTPYGRAFVAQSMTWAELEAQNGGIRVRDVFKNKVEHGEVITGKVPRGYRIENKHLELSEEAPIIAAAFRTVWDTQSMGKGWQYLRDHGIHMTINNFYSSVLRNEKYTGRYRDNDHYCPRIVSDQIFFDIQKMIAEHKNVRSNSRYSYVFSGMLICNECGYAMPGVSYSSRYMSGGQLKKIRKHGYECKRSTLYHECPNGGQINEIVIERYLLSCIRGEISSYIASYESHLAPVIDNRTRKQTIQKKLNKLKDLYLNELISLDEYKADHEAYMKQLQELPDIIESTNNISKLKQLLNDDFESLYSTFSNEEKRFFWRSILKEIRVSKSTNRHRTYTLIFL